MTLPEIAVTRDGNVVIARPVGDIDLANVEAVGVSVLDAVLDDCDGLVLDLSTVRYLDSAGVQMVFDLVRRLSATRRRLAITVPEGSAVRALLKITNVNEAAPIVATVDQAVAVLAADADLS